MGALKGRFQCLRGLRVNINSSKDHAEACRWITIAIILHNMVINIEGANAATNFGGIHTGANEIEDRGGADEPEDDDELEEAGEAKRIRLVAELLAYKSL
jgi:hypothetical protein